MDWDRLLIVIKASPMVRTDLGVRAPYSLSPAIASPPQSFTSHRYKHSSLLGHEGRRLRLYGSVSILPPQGGPEIT